MLDVNGRYHHNDLMDSCNATQKFGSKVAICDLPHGHPGMHRSTLGATTQKWSDDWHSNGADVVVNPN